MNWKIKKQLKRIKEAEQYVNIDHICISPQCGFASTEEGNALTEQEQWNKLAYVVELANELLARLNRKWSEMLSSISFKINLFKRHFINVVILNSINEVSNY